MHIFVVNLPRDISRREAIEKQLSGFGLPYEIFPAISGKDIDPVERLSLYDETGFLRNEGRPATAGELGCALSHIGIFRMITERNIPYALILEDDAWLNPNLPHLLNAIVQKYPPEQDNVFLLGWTKSVSYKKMQTLWSSYRVVKANSAYCTHGYVVSNAAAAKLLNILHPVKHLADCWNWLYQNRHINLLAVSPPCITMDLSYESGITPQNTTVSSHRPFAKSVTHKLYRAWWLYVNIITALSNRIWRRFRLVKQ